IVRRFADDARTPHLDRPESVRRVDAVPYAVPQGDVIEIDSQTLISDPSAATGSVHPTPRHRAAASALPFHPVTALGLDARDPASAPGHGRRRPTSRSASASSRPPG